MPEPTCRIADILREKADQYELTIFHRDAIVWAAVIFASAVVLKGTPYWAQMLPILGGGAGATIIILGGARYKGRNQ